jgi:hypothetical protein
MRKALLNTPCVPLLPRNVAKPRHLAKRVPAKGWKEPAFRYGWGLQNLSLCSLNQDFCSVVNVLWRRRQIIKDDIANEA